MGALSPRALAAGLAGLLALGGCSGYDDGYGYGGVSVGYGSAGYYDPWYGGSYGWYDGFYYPGSGYYIFDRAGRRHRWNDHHRHHWQSRRGDRHDDRREWRDGRRDGDRDGRNDGDRRREWRDGRRDGAGFSGSVTRRGRGEDGVRQPTRQRPNLIAPERVRPEPGARSLRAQPEERRSETRGQDTNRRQPLSPRNDPRRDRD